FSDRPVNRACCAWAGCMNGNASLLIRHPANTAGTGAEGVTVTPPNPASRTPLSTPSRPQTDSGDRPIGADRNDRTDRNDGCRPAAVYLSAVETAGKMEARVALERYHIRLSREVVTALEFLSRKVAFRENRTITWADLVRRGCQLVIEAE